MLSIDNILVARDYSSVSDRALASALGLAARTGATLHVLHAKVLHAMEDSGQDGPTPSDGIDRLREALRDARDVSPKALDAVSVVGETRRDVAPAPAILQYASEEGIDLIALGTHGRRGTSRILLGSVAEEVVRRADQPVLTVRGEDEEEQSPLPDPIERILVPIDFSEYSREALAHAKEGAALYGAQIDVLHVIEETLHPAFYVGGVRSIYDAQPNIEEKARTQMETFVDETPGPDVETTLHVGPGKAASTISEVADEQEVDLVAMSTHGRTGMERFFLGSVAEKVVRHVRCPVLTVKAFGRSLVSGSAEKHGSAGGEGSDA